MRFLEKTKIQHFLLTSFQHLNDLYPCSRIVMFLLILQCIILGRHIFVRFAFHADADVVVAHILADFDGLCVCLLSYSSWMVNGWCLTIFAFPSFKSRRTLPRRKVGIKRSPLLLRTQTQVLMQGTPFVNNESISQGLRPVVHFANVMHCFSLSAWLTHFSYP